MKQIYSTLLLGVLTITGCGGGGSTPSSNRNLSSDNPPSSRQTLAQIHKYTVEAIPTSGGNCKGATGEMIVNGSGISGTITTGWGDVLIIGGTYVSSSGNVSGGFAKNNIRLAEYHGNIANNRVSGTWSDSLGCSGTWSGVGEKSNYISTQNSRKNFDPYNLEGHTIKYSEYYINYSLALGCDGSYMMNAMRRGIAMPSEYGDKIDISADKIKFGHLVSFILIDGNLVVGKSRDATLGGLVTSITQTKVCN